jgi:hypothetical protein
MKFSNCANKVLITLLGVYAGQLLFVLPVNANTADNPQTQEVQNKGASRTKTTNKKSKCKKIGTKNTHKVPEPLTILGVGATLGSLPIFKKHYKSKNRK